MAQDTSLNAGASWRHYRLMNHSAPPGEAEVEDATTEEMDYLIEKLEIICLANT